MIPKAIRIPAAVRGCLDICWRMISALLARKHTVYQVKTSRKYLDNNSFCRLFSNGIVLESNSREIIPAEEFAAVEHKCGLHHVLLDAAPVVGLELIPLGEHGDGVCP